VKIALKCSDETHEEDLVSIPGNATSNNPNDVLDIAFELDQFTFPGPGIYCFELRADEAIILSTRLNVIKVTPG